MLAKVVTKRLKATIGTSNCKICFTEAVIRKAYLPTIDIPENSLDFQHLQLYNIIFINIPQIKSPMLQTYVSWGVVQVSWWTQTECLMDDSKLKEPGSPHWPAKQLRGMRLKICLLEGQVTICNRALKIYQKCINHEATTATRTRKMHDATHKKEKYYKDRRTGCKIELKWKHGKHETRSIQLKNGIAMHRHLCWHLLQTLLRIHLLPNQTQGRGEVVIRPVFGVVQKVH